MADVGGALGAMGGGAATGMAVGGPWGATIGAGVGLVGSLVQGDAAGKLSEAQLAEQRATRSLAMGAAAPTTEELQMMSHQMEQYSRVNSFQQQELGRIQQSLGSMFPQMGEITKQLTGALRGENTQWMQPIEMERARGREALNAQASERMGGGYQQSTAGLGAMSNYDYQTGQLLSNARLQGIQTLSGLQNNTIAGMGALSGQAMQGEQLQAGLSGQVFQQQGSLANRMISAINATPTAPYVGGQFMQQQAAGGALAGLGKSASEAFTTQWAKGSALGGSQYNPNSANIAAGQTAARNYFNQ